MELTGCSATKFVPDNEYMLVKSELQCRGNEQVDLSSLSPYVRQKGNSKWFSLLKIPLGVYALSGTDTTRWLNRRLQAIGEAPVIYDESLAELTCKDLQAAVQNRGYLHAKTSVEKQIRGKKMKVAYVIDPGNPYHVNSIRYEFPDEEIAQIVGGQPAGRRISEGMRFDIGELDAERKRITTQLMDSGYYRFNKDFIQYDADSTRTSQGVDLTLRMLPYNEKGAPHPKYTIRNIRYLNGDVPSVPALMSQNGEETKMRLRRNVLVNNTALQEGKPFSATALQRTYNNFARLQAVRYTNIRFTEVPDTTLLDCDIQVSTHKSSTISFQPEGTNTAGDLGAAAVLGYENRNLFRGSELLSIQLRAAFEAITGLEGYQNEDYEEYSFETKLTFPRMVAPFLSRDFVRNSRAVSELAVGYNMQDRPEFHRRVFSGAWRYRWNEPQRNSSYRLDLLDLNYVYMPWISPTFKQDYLDNTTNRNAILRYNYEDLFIMKIGLGYQHSNSRSSLRTNIETAGNILSAAANLMGNGKNAQGQHTLFNIAFAQYVKGDFDYTRLVRFDEHNSLAMHLGLGIAYPYGNSNMLPFEKRYFSGGANSVRGWGVRGLGPGKFKGTDGRIDFINQTGDMKLDASIEYRTSLFWKFAGAVFVDAGNIWTLREYADQPGGQFKLDEFYQQIAVAYGLGLRLNFDYFILRFDFGMKAINPAYETSKEHYAVIHPDLSRDFSFHFAVGLPF